MSVRLLRWREIVSASAGSYLDSRAKTPVGGVFFSYLRINRRRTEQSGEQESDFAR
jgi:hypothetical protein